MGDAIFEAGRECVWQYLGSQAPICMLNWGHPAFGVRGSRGLEPNTRVWMQTLARPTLGLPVDALPRRRCRGFLLRFDDHRLLVSDAT